MQIFKQSEAAGVKTRFHLHLVDATDGITPETAEAGGQPQISKGGAAFVNTTNTLVAIGNGGYYVQLTATELDALGFILVRYKSANTAEFQRDSMVVAYDPYAAANLGLTNLDAAITSRAPEAGGNVAAIKAKTDQLVFTIANKVDASIQAAADFAQGAADKVWSSASRTLTAFSTALALSVWDVLESAILTASSIGLKVKTNLDAAITSRSSHTAADVWSVGSRTLTSFGTLVSDIWANSSRTLTSLGSSLVAEIWNALTSGMTTVGSIGKRVADNLDATISSRSTLTAADVWANATRTLTSFGTLVFDIWANATRTLTGFGTLVSDIWSHDLSTTDEDVITGRKGASVLMAIFKRFYHKVTQSGTQQIVYKADNTTAFGTMSTTEGPPQEKGKAA